MFRLSPKINYLASLVFALVCATTKATAGDTITVAPSFYHIDKAHKLILINKSASEINAASTAAKTHLALDAYYVLQEQPVSVSTASSYHAELNNSSYTIYFTELPIIHIDAKNEIIDSPSIYAKFRMSEANGAVTKSNLGIEIRGGWSQTYPKKSYELSLWQDTTGAETQDMSLLNLRNDNKWNLQAMYNEPLRNRNKASHELWQEIHQIYYKDKEPDAKNGIDMAYVELFLNDEYKGVYALSERIDRKQLKLKKYNNGIVGELYKGGDWGPAVMFTGLPAIDNTSLTWGGFEYKHPEEKTDWSNLYDFVGFVENSSNQDFYSQYQKRFNLKNAVDYYIFLNLIRATDNTGKNIYLAKYKTGEPYYYVPWDLDGVFGTDWQGQYINITNDILCYGLYKRLTKDNSYKGFNETLYSRWDELRSTVLTEDHILAKFQANHDYLLKNNVYEREHTIWQEFTYNEADIPYTTTWLKNRLRYLDIAFDQSSSVLKNKASQQNSAVTIYPNPANNYLIIESEAASHELAIQDMNGKVVLTSLLRGKTNKLDIGHLIKGVYVVVIKNDKSVSTQKLIIN
ncbi:CotH kinase family protein [Hymenobacter cavernae]|uniref:Secretion system C-terminal sorting domain-containing protein n=1 Tax=Hymenobacter cavernae TaxID=2044852 RepID=A0ABQ1THC7_9BACT|nr:CotH kinase family protein [Hymenobacter cavernae]GGE93415.1 hypothetical protein GCM10011383_00120 [Hymenobacter cavernae]